MVRWQIVHWSVRGGGGSWCGMVLIDYGNSQPIRITPLLVETILNSIVRKRFRLEKLPRERLTKGTPYLNWWNDNTACYWRLGQNLASQIQCCQSGSGGFWTSRIRIRHYFVRIRILPTTRKKVRKTLICTILWLLFDFLSMKTDVNVPSKRKKAKNFRTKM